MYDPYLSYKLSIAGRYIEANLILGSGTKVGPLLEPTPETSLTKKKPVFDRKI